MIKTIDSESKTMYDTGILYKAKMTVAMPPGRKKGATYKKTNTKQIDPTLCPHSDLPYYANGRCKACDLAYQRSLKGRGEGDEAYSKSDKAKERRKRYEATEKGQKSVARAIEKRKAKLREQTRLKRLAKLQQDAANPPEVP